MIFLKRNKYHFAGIAGVVLLFVISVLVRHESLSQPLSRHHEWITAHTLITCEIWEENGGPQAHHFSPVYTYPGEGNQKRKMLGGVVDEQGNVYYVSYPPFAFLFAYYSTKLLGGADTDSIRTLSLTIHLLCSIFIYLIASSFLPEAKKFHLSLAGLTGAFLYLFSTGNLWAHGNLYFADMLVQLFIISALYFIILFTKESSKSPKLLLTVLCLILFAATYTEWLGLFLAFFTGIFFLICYIVRKKRKFFIAFLSIGFVSSFAILLTIIQYSSISGWENLKETSTKKYQQRSGHESAEDTPSQYNLENDEAYDFMISGIDQYYEMAEKFTVIFCILLVLILLIPNARHRIENAPMAISILLLLICAVILHYYLFFNFNSLHDFSSLKTGFVIILISVIAISMIESALNTKFNIVLFLLIGYLSVDKGLKSISDYHEYFPLSEVNWNRIHTAEMIRKYARPDQAVFLNIQRSPELVYTAKHSVLPIKDTSELLNLMDYFGNTSGQYYHHRGQQLEYVQEFEKADQKIIFTNRMTFTRMQTGEGKTHQK